MKVVYQNYAEPADPPLTDALPTDQPPALSTRRRRQNPPSQFPLQAPPQPPPHAPPDELNDASRRHIRTAINNAWEKLDKYYALTDETPVYLAALVLHPGQKWRYFEKRWVDHEDWVDDAKAKMLAFYQEHWENRPTPDILPTRPGSRGQHRELAAFQLWLTPHDYYTPDDVPVDEYEAYVALKPVPVDNPIEWWRDHQTTYPKLAQMAFDLLSIPAMSAECERVFSQAKLAVNHQRNRLLETTLDALQCMKNWLRNKVFSLVS